MRLDLHIHSRHSDGRDDVEDILRMAARRGLAGLSITDHNTLDGSIAARKAVRKLGLDLIIIMGTEISTSDGHLLALGIEDLPPRDRSAEETIEAVHEEGGIAIAPHPYHPFRHSLWRIPPVDAVEVFNSRHFIGLANGLAYWQARRRGLPMVAGSDSHVRETVGLGVTEVFADEPEGILPAIVAGKTRIIGKRTPASVLVGQLERRIGRISIVRRL